MLVVGDKVVIIGPTHHGEYGIIRSRVVDRDRVHRSGPTRSV